MYPHPYLCRPHVNWRNGVVRDGVGWGRHPVASVMYWSSDPWLWGVKPWRPTVTLATMIATINTMTMTTKIVVRSKFVRVRWFVDPERQGRHFQQGSKPLHCFLEVAQGWRWAFMARRKLRNSLDETLMTSPQAGINYLLGRDSSPLLSETLQSYSVPWLNHEIVGETSQECAQGLHFVCHLKRRVGYTNETGKKDLNKQLPDYRYQWECMSQKSISIDAGE